MIAVGQIAGGRLAALPPGPGAATAPGQEKKQEEQIAPTPPTEESSTAENQNPPPAAPAQDVADKARASEAMAGGSTANVQAQTNAAETSRVARPRPAAQTQNESPVSSAPRGETALDEARQLAEAAIERARDAGLIERMESLAVSWTEDRTGLTAEPAEREDPGEGSGRAEMMEAPKEPAQPMDRRV